MPAAIPKRTRFGYDRAACSVAQSTGFSVAVAAKVFAQIRDLPRELLAALKAIEYGVAEGVHSDKSSAMRGKPSSALRR